MFPSHDPIEFKNLAPIWLQTDKSRLYQLVFNLLDNATKYASKNSTIKILAYNQELEISNNTESETYLAGLGLSICHKIATKLGFRLSLSLESKQFVAKVTF